MQFNHDIIDFQKGEVNLENVTHEEAVATLKTTQDRVVLVVAKPESAFTAPASEASYSPQLCKCRSYLLMLLHKIIIFIAIKYLSS